MDQMKENLNIDPGDDANAKKRARELSGDSKGLDHMQVFLESRKAEELREPTRLICYMEKPKDFFDLTSGFTYDVAERASKNELQGSYRDYWFERRVEWNKAAKVGIIKCEDSSNIELIAGALREYAKKKDIDCRIIRLSELIEDWTVCLLLLNDSPMVKMGTDKAVISRYLQLNLAENGIPANTWHLVAAMQPFTGKVKIYKTVNGKRVDTGERKNGKVGNTLAVIHLKTHLLKKIGEEGLAFQHGRVPVKVSGHEKILLHDYEAPEQDNANMVPLGERRSDGEKNLDQLAKGSSKAPSRGGRGGGRGGRGRGGNPVPGRTTGPEPKRQKQQEQTKEVMVISPSHKLSEKSRTEIEADLRKNGSAGSTLLPMDFSRCKPDGQKPFWKDVAQEFQDYVQDFQRKEVPEINLWIKSYQQLVDGTYEGPELSVAGASNASFVLERGKKTLRNQNKKRGAQMNVLCKKVLAARQAHLKRLEELHSDLIFSNTGGDVSYLSVKDDIEKLYQDTAITIADPKKVKMIPHDIV